MSSINTNVASMTALQTLKSVQGSLTDTQSRVSTGFKVNNAKDHAAYFSVATTMRADSSAFNAISENLSIGKASVAVAREGTQEVGELAKQVLERVSFAQAGDSVDRSLIQNEVDDLVSQMSTVLAQSTYNGENLLDTTDAVTVVTGVSRDAGTYGTTSFSFNEVDMGAIVTAITTAVTGLAGMDASALEAALQGVETQIAAVTDASANFGLVERRIEQQQDFVSKLVDKFDQGVGSLVDADMNKEAARLSALQVQEQLATQALSIANQQPQSILSLFR